MISEYVRAMRFLYEKEFLAPKRANAAAAIAELYRERGLSTDTAIEAGYLVHLGLATIAAADSTRRIERVLIVGPGLDLAPRTGLLEVGEPESYQPYAVLDSLVQLGLGRAEQVVIVGGDVNPRVVDRLRSAGNRDVTLSLVTGIGESKTVRFDEGYRSYVGRLGSSIGTPLSAPVTGPRLAGHLKKALRPSPAAARAITAARLDIVTDRLDGDRFDLVVVTNVFPYLSDVELTLALANIAAMLEPGGVLIHNEPRALAREVTAELGLPVTHSRTAIIATVEGSATPLYDSVFVHVRLPLPLEPGRDLRQPRVVRLRRDLPELRVAEGGAGEARVPRRVRQVDHFDSQHEPAAPAGAEVLVERHVDAAAARAANAGKNAR